MTDANVPISTATDAGSIQLSFCRAITNTFRAGGSEAINTAVAAHGCANGPSSSINPNTTSGWIRILTAMIAGTSQGCSGRPLALPQAKPMKISPKYGNARLRTSTMREFLFRRYWPQSEDERTSIAKG
jgi:hypothetical protein